MSDSEEDLCEDVKEILTRLIRGCEEFVTEQATECKNEVLKSEQRINEVVDRRYEALSDTMRKECQQLRESINGVPQIEEELKQRDVAIAKLQKLVDTRYGELHDTLRSQSHQLQAELNEKLKEHANNLLDARFRELKSIIMTQSQTIQQLQKDISQSCKCREIFHVVMESGKKVLDDSYVEVSELSGISTFSDEVSIQEIQENISVVDREVVISERGDDIISTAFEIATALEQQPPQQQLQSEQEQEDQTQLQQEQHQQEQQDEAQQQQQTQHQQDEQGQPQQQQHQQTQHHQDEQGQPQQQRTQQRTIYATLDEIPTEMKAKLQPYHRPSIMATKEKLSPLQVAFVRHFMNTTSTTSNRDSAEKLFTEGVKHGMWALDFIPKGVVNFRKYLTQRLKNETTNKRTQELLNDLCSTQKKRMKKMLQKV